MWRVYAVIGAVWLALLPPLFTGGQCSAEFARATAQLREDMSRLRTATEAQAYWESRSVPVTTLTVEQCRQTKPRFLAKCGSGPLVYARVPVQNTICRIYRDDDIRIQLQYDNRGLLSRVATDMDPFKSLPLPFVGVTLHWGR